MARSRSATFRSWLDLAGGLGITFLVMIAGDWLVHVQPGVGFGALSFPLELLFRLMDVPVHGLLALAVISPGLMVPQLRPRWPQWAALAVSVTMLLDLDHAWAARSFSLVRVMNLPERPATHSLAFALFVTLLAYLLVRRWVAGRRGLPAWVAWLVLAGLASHLLRDASGGGTPLFWPLHTKHISVPLYYVAEAGLFLLTWAFSSRQPGWYPPTLELTTKYYQKLGPIPVHGATIADEAPMAFRPSSTTSGHVFGEPWRIRRAEPAEKPPRCGTRPLAGQRIPEPVRVRDHPLD